MKGITKAIKRTPHLVTSKAGYSKKSSDPEFDDFNVHFAALEQATEKLLKDTKAYTDAVTALLTGATGLGNHFNFIFSPLSGEIDHGKKYPASVAAIANTPAYAEHWDELRSAIAPELELIESRVVGPVKEFQGVLKTIRKTITKRDHKLIDFDRFNNSLTKLRDKKEKSLNDEKNLFKLEQDVEAATNDYDFINDMLKRELPRFMQLTTQFIDPLFHSFYYMQLNIYYLLLEKLNSFAETRYQITNGPASQIQSDYENNRTDAWSCIEDLGITKRIVSTSKFVHAKRAESGAGAPMGRTPSMTTTSSTTSFASRSMPPPTSVPPPAKFVHAQRAESGVGPTGRTPGLATMSSTTSFASRSMPPPSYSSTPPLVKKAPPPPPPPSLGQSSALPPPYSKVEGPTKRPPPPPPPLKPKPKPEPVVEYVTALFDFDAQADGDLSFKTGDRIEIVKKTESQEDWWTGRLNGAEGVFPGNYVQC